MNLAVRGMVNAGNPLALASPIVNRVPLLA